MTAERRMQGQMIIYIGENEIGPLPLTKHKNSPWIKDLNVKDKL